MELTALIHASVEALDGSDAVKQLVGICMRIRVSIRQRGKERKGKARPAMAKQAKQDRQADGSSTVVYMHALWLKLCGPSSRMCVCVCAQAPCCSSSALLLFARVRIAPIQQRLYMVADATMYNVVECCDLHAPGQMDMDTFKCLRG